MKIKPKKFNNAQAHLEGWALTTTHGRWDIQSYGAVTPFTSDFDAQCHVRDMADKGYPYHQIAIELFLRRTN